MSDETSTLPSSQESLEQSAGHLLCLLSIGCAAGALTLYDCAVGRYSVLQLATAAGVGTEIAQKAAMDLWGESLSKSHAEKYQRHAGKEPVEETPNQDLSCE